MHNGGIFLVLVGLAGVGFSAWGLVTGEASIVWSRLGGWGSLSSRASRDVQPAMFWAATLFYGGAGLLLAGFGVYRMMQPGA